MIDVFDARDNEKLLAAIQELTSQLAVAQNKITELEKGADVPTPTVADAGKVLGVDDEGKYAIVEGGGGSDEAILTVNDQKMGLICTNPLADIWHMYRDIPTASGEIKIQQTLIKGETVIFYNQDTSILELGNQLYYLDEHGNEIPYSGIKNFAQIDILSVINGTMVTNAFGEFVLQTATDSGLVVDIDTGHIIYLGRIN